MVLLSPHLLGVLRGLGLADVVPGQRLLPNPQLEGVSPQFLTLTTTPSHPDVGPTPSSAAGSVTSTISPSFGSSSSAHASSATYSNSASHSLPGSTSLSELLSSSSAIAASTSSISPSSTSIGLERRAAIPACLKTVELSCLNLAAYCIDSVNADNRFNLWGIRSCAVAATCYGVGDLIASARCQTGFTDIANNNQAALNYNTIYTGLVGSCASQSGGCPVTQQNYIDWYYGTLTQINTANWPSANTVVIAYFTALRTWTATGNTVPYNNLNDFYHYSTYPPAVTTTSTTRAAYIPVPWNPNSIPSPGAVSQTFVKSSTTVVIPIPTVTVTITVVDETITLAPGGTPVGGAVPTDITQPGAVAPTFNPNPIVSSTSSSVTFVAGTWTSIVAVPTSSSAPVTVHGPPDDGDDDDDNDSWLLVFGLFGFTVVGSLPASVSIIGAFIPVATPPTDWPDDGSWTPPPFVPPGGSDDPDDPDDDDDPDDPDDPPTCTFRALPPYTLPYDGESGMDDDDDGSFVRRTIDLGHHRRSSNATLHRLYKRAVRRIVLGKCDQSFSRNGVTLGVANWYTINPPNAPVPFTSATTNLEVTNNARHIANDGKIAEHLFEFRYIKDFFETQFPNVADCNWLTANVWTPNANALIQAIDQQANLVWVAKELNQAKSYITNNDCSTLDNPPRKNDIDGLSSIDPNSASAVTALQIETIIRAIGVVGDYFQQNSAQFRATAQRVMNILSQITPETPVFPPLDTRFYNYMATTYSTYPAGISDRGTRMLTRYRQKMDSLLAQAVNAQPPPQVPPTIPPCFAVYHDNTIANRIATAGNRLNWQSLIPAPIPHPACNTAGTPGKLILYYDAVDGHPVKLSGDPTFVITALGGPQYGIKLAQTQITMLDYHLVDHYGPTCNGIHALPIGIGNIPTAKFNLNCLGGFGRTLADLQYVDPGGTPRLCFINNFNDGTGGFAIVCGPSRAAVDTCLTHVNQVDGNANAYTSVPYLRFQGF